MNIFDNNWLKSLKCFASKIRLTVKWLHTNSEDPPFLFDFILFSSAVENSLILKIARNRHFLHIAHIAQIASSTHIRFAWKTRHISMYMCASLLHTRRTHSIISQHTLAHVHMHTASYEQHSYAYPYFW